MSTAVQYAERLELLHSFVEEARDILDEVEPRLVELEKGSIELGSVNGETIHAIFRLFHSLKCSAGYLDLQTISRRVAAETGTGRIVLTSPGRGEWEL